MARLTSEQRAVACDRIAEHLKACATQEALEKAYYKAKVEYLACLGDTYLLELLWACDFTEKDLISRA